MTSGGFYLEKGVFVVTIMNTIQTKFESETHGVVGKKLSTILCQGL